jgi:protein-S-isoprenylcysteine O-methyltransferase Ste14
MKASIRKLVAILSVVTAFAVVMPFAASDACAQQKAANAPKQLIGHWTLVSLVVLGKIVAEERLLRASFPGYEQYARSTKAVIPFVL